MAIRLSENFRALFYAPFYAAHAIGAYHAEGVDVTLLASPDPARTAAALRSGDVDVMWGGPLRVLLNHAQDPASDSVCFCDVIARDPFFIIGRAPRPNFRISDLARRPLRLGRRGANAVAVPAGRSAPRRRSIRRRWTRTSGPSMAENAAALRAATFDAVQLFQPYAEELIASGAGHLWYAAADRGLTAYTVLVTRRPLLDTRRDELLAMTRAMTSTLRWMAATSGSDIARALQEFFPTVAPDIFAAAIDRYRALKLFATDPMLQREGFDRLQMAMRSGGALDRPIAFETCVDNSLARQVLVDDRPAE